MSERKKEELVCIVHSKESSLAMLAKNPLDMNNILSLILESYVDRILRETDTFW